MTTRLKLDVSAGRIGGRLLLARDASYLELRGPRWQRHLVWGRHMQQGPHAGRRRPRWTHPVPNGRDSIVALRLGSTIRGKYREGYWRTR